MVTECKVHARMLAKKNIVMHVDLLFVCVCVCVCVIVH